ncbi:MAG: endonuclease III domain-containing protein [Dehalococcoidia bacterium]|nr:endonuclease III domain-containing protein [Dehalococcoidia bacterium]
MHDRLTDIYDRLLERYGPRDWWPADSRFEVMVGAVLVQNTAWSNAEKAIRALSEAGLLSPQALRSTGQDQIAQLIYSSGYYNMKAKKLKALVEWLGERDDDIEALMAEDPATLREDLLAIHGIGEETADDILLYALDMPVFVIDHYTKRLLHRLGLAPEKGPYALYQRLFTDHLPPDVPLFNEYHALIVTHAARVCKKEPVCGECCLLSLCPTGKART